MGFDCYSQVDGPRHFTANTLQPLGPTLLKQRQLAAAGWCLVSVPFHEWTRLRGRDAKQVPHTAYCLQL
jgi:RAP domain